ncbi:fumarylacetoacetate hydrolase family protein [Streptomyces sp. WI04-05B]|uniref:fumarylacetoacetate hydrolase family protein n=1 Tax=Streptomyces TaxID=1883 RepID=UPI0029BF2075|nr:MULTISPECIES: fumarylacetoacetate hydrolase family protein [unclassified Streptomyces]MDX2546984.1 fumarylacetoacetate hydrolase family protein [Streptomyces sp. WI04-05B]MDX2589368.1 fumarylacetoacetate hydrolase family protein [Streptomyces sp. WI04-05A]MDX3748152.1 fumarylacetoacetate hydrolase family protein [Streptomyces sp. AK08-02]
MTLPDWSLVQYRDSATERPAVGILAGDDVYEGPADFAGLSLLDVLRHWDKWVPALLDWSPQQAAPVCGARLAAPLTYPGKVLCAGANYWDHIAEMGIERPTELGDPFFFLKPPTTTVTGPGDPVRLPAYEGARVDWEAELGVVIGRPGRDLTTGEALAHVAGYVAANDISARDRLTAKLPVASPFTYDWLGHKGQDGFCPIGPGLVPAWQIPDPQDLRIRLTVNGVVKQDSSTRQMMVPVAEVVAAASRLTSLEPGDLILTGTPAGCGLPRGEFLAAGDEVVVEIEHVGRLHNTVVAP